MHATSFIAFFVSSLVSGLIIVMLQPKAAQAGSKPSAAVEQAAQPLSAGKIRN